MSNQTKIIKDRSLIVKLFPKLYEFCDHVKTVEDCYSIIYESDSFGPLEYIGLCKECHDKGRKEEEEETVICRDCHKEIKKKDAYYWKWEEFYAAQGDVPYVICRECRSAPRHRMRVAKDRAPIFDFQKSLDDSYFDWLSKIPE